MTVRESPAGLQAISSLESRDRAPGPLQQAPTFRGQSQRADNLADLLTLDNVISQGIHEDWTLRQHEALANSKKQRMMSNAATIVETTRSSW
ncbi:MAG: hypothetical protein AB8C46_03840 [Burkholderiaceae bacterium]